MAEQMGPAIVLGLGVNGLGTARALGRRGVRVIALTNGRRTPPTYTRFAERMTCPGLENDPEALITFLCELGRRLPAKGVIFPSGDYNLEAVSEHREALEPYYHLPIAAKETIRLILSKGLFYRFAQERGLPIAPTFFPVDGADIRRIAGVIRYPCLMKPSIATSEWRRRGLKLLLAHDAAELERHYAMAAEIQSDLVVQEITPGPDRALEFSLTYLNRAGTPLAMFTGRKVRQWIPQFGISSMAESEWLPEVDRITRETLARLQYTGYGSIEFKRDPRDNTLVMTEVTGRTWYPHALSQYCGINLPYLAWCDLTGHPLPALPERFEEGVKWIDEVGDWKSAAHYRRAGELTLGSWLGSYRGRRHWAICTADDPMPGLALGAHLAKEGVKNVLRAGWHLVRPPRTS
jgi:predicted ATP-grasp superfamily ATP-dependent carboligase